MSLKNHTSGVAVDRSVSLIERELVRAGAKHISKWYDEKGNLEGITFQIDVHDNPMVFRLPAKWRAAKDLMMKEIRRPKPTTERTVTEQAQRTAWKLLYDWVQVQVSMIQLDQAEFAEMFLQYWYDGSKDKTFFELVKAGGFKLLKA